MMKMILFLIALCYAADAAPIQNGVEFTENAVDQNARIKTMKNFWTNYNSKKYVALNSRFSGNKRLSGAVAVANLGSSPVVTTITSANLTVSTTSSSTSWYMTIVWLATPSSVFGVGKVGVYTDGSGNYYQWAEVTPYAGYSITSTPFTGVTKTTSGSTHILTRSLSSAPSNEHCGVYPIVTCYTTCWISGYSAYSLGLFGFSASATIGGIQIESSYDGSGSCTTVPTSNVQWNDMRAYNAGSGVLGMWYSSLTSPSCGSASAYAPGTYDLDLTLTNA